MFTKLKRLLIARQRGETTSSLPERLRFSRRQEKRDRCMSKLEKRIEQLMGLMQRVSRTPFDIQVAPDIDSKRPSQSSKPPSIQARNLVANLHNILCNHQACCCTEKRQITLCLGHQKDDVRESSVEIDFLLSNRDNWQEGKVIITSSSK